MNDVTVATTLQSWENFYVIVGSSAGALTGLQFVVLTLIAETRPTRGRKESIAAFGSPTVVHFCASLLVAALLSAPWPNFVLAGIGVAGVGAFGVAYSVLVLRRARRQDAYQPVLEDWVWHTILPMVAYAALLVSGMVLGQSSPVLFLIAGATLLLVFIGIHNAWDTVTYVTLLESEAESAEVEPASAPAGDPESRAAAGAPRA